MAIFSESEDGVSVNLAEKGLGGGFKLGMLPAICRTINPLKELENFPYPYSQGETKGCPGQKN
ncbi:MAG TPA: hypothetical protein DIW47_12800 [Bacteroidetes bacterium]|nr:hypothetical protein [Bacteroidota bacterium]